MSVNEIKKIMNFAEKVDDGYNLVKKILQTGMNPNCTNDFGMTLFHKSAKYGNVTNLLWLSKMSSIDHNIVNDRNRRGETALFIACYYGHYRFVKKILMMTHTNTEIIDNIFYNTPLQMAFERGHLTILQLLLNHGAEYSPHVINKWIIPLDMINEIMNPQNRYVNLNLRRFMGMKEYITEITGFFMSRNIKSTLCFYGSILQETSRNEMYIANPETGEFELSLDPGTTQERDTIPVHLINHHKQLMLNMHETCPICMEIYTETENIIVLETTKCYHILCKHCYDKVNQCPMCRKEIIKT